MPHPATRPRARIAWGVSAGGDDGDGIYRHGGFRGLHAAVIPDRRLAIAAVRPNGASTHEITQMVEILARTMQDGP